MSSNTRPTAEELKKIQIGLNTEALDKQVHDHHNIKLENAEREKKYADQYRQSTERGMSQDQSRREESRKERRDMDRFRHEHQRKEQGNDFDLNDRNAWKTEQPDKNWSDSLADYDIRRSSLVGEDPNNQREQLDDNECHQQKSKQLGWDPARVGEHDRDYQPQNEENAEHRRDACQNAQDNRHLASMVRERRADEKTREDMQDRRNVEFNKCGEFTTEKRSLPAVDPHRAVPDGWKNMSEHEHDQENQRKKEDKRDEWMEWEDNAEGRHNASNHPDDLKRERRELHKHEHKKHENRGEYFTTNVLTSEYSDQFNASTR